MVVTPARRENGGNSGDGKIMAPTRPNQLAEPMLYLFSLLQGFPEALIKFRILECYKYVSIQRYMVLNNVEMEDISKLSRFRMFVLRVLRVKYC